MDCALDRADLHLNFSVRNKNVMLDVTVTNPRPNRNAVPGLEAADKVKAKTAAYLHNYAMDPRELVVFAVETPGNICAEGRTFIRNLARRAAASSRHESDYPRTVTSIYQRVGVALQNGNAEMLARFVTSCVGTF